MDVSRVNKSAACSQCSQQFMIRDPLHPHGSRCPLILHCGHSACEQCIRTAFQSNDNIVCSICKHKSCLKNGIIRKDFPLNVYLLGSFADRQGIKEQGDSKVMFLPAGSNVGLKGPNIKNGIKTELCSECGLETADWGCHDCGVSYCSPCFNKVHKAAKALQKHKKYVPGMQNTSFRPQPQCKFHPEHKLEFHCKQCEVYLCPYCVIKTHAGHPVCTLKMKNEASLPEMKEAYDKATDVLRRLVKAQKDLKNVSVAATSGSKLVLSDTIIQTQRAVSRHFVHLHGILQLLEVNLLGRLESVANDVIRNVDAVTTELDTHIEKVKQLLELAKVTVDPANLPRADFMDVHKKLLDTEDLPCHLIANDNPEKIDIEFTVNRAFMDEIEKHCQLQISSVKKFNLVRTLDLPPDVKIEPIEDLLETGSSRASSLSCLSDSAMSDNGTSVSQSETMSVPSSIKGSIEIVTVCHIKDPSSFYVHKQSDRKAINNLCKLLAKYVTQGPMVPTEILEDGLYLVQFSADSNWYRARVKALISRLLNSDEDMAEVMYIDYGNTEVVPLSRLRCISAKHAQVSPLAQHCSLFGLVPPGDKWSQESIKTMAQMLDGFVVAMTVMGYSCNVFQVDLSCVPGEEENDVPISVRDAMVFLEMGCFLDSVVPSARISGTEKFYLKDEDFGKGNIYDVLTSHVNTPMSFYVQKLGSHAKYLTNLMEDMNKLYGTCGKKGIIYTPKIGMPCAARYSADKKWYRARVVALPGKTKVEIFYVDYGNEEVVCWNSLRKLHDRFLRLAPQAVHCCMTDVVPNCEETWSPDAKAWLEEVTMKKMLKLFVDTQIDVLNSVTLYDSQDTVDICLNALLVRKGFAISTGSSSVLVEYHKTGARVLATNFTKKASSVQSRKQPTTQINGAVVRRNCLQPSKVAVPPTKDDDFRLEVRVLSCKSPSCLYMSLTSQECFIEDLMQEIQEYYSTSTSHGKQWKVDDRCCAFVEKEEQWYRGVIVQLVDDQAKVFLTDFAHVITVPLTDLQYLIPKFTEIRDGAFKCSLAGIKAAGDKEEWPSLACEMLNDFMNLHDRLFITKKGNISNFSLPVELWVKEVIQGGPLDPTVEEWHTLNRKLVDQGLAIPVQSDSTGENVPSYLVLKELEEQSYSIPPPESEIDLYKKENMQRQSSLDDKQSSSEEDGEDEDENEQCITEWIPSVPIDKTKFMAVPTYVDDECCIYIHDIASEETLRVIQRALQSRLQNTQPKPHDLYWFAGQLCIAQYHDKNWYRGKVLEINDDHSVKVLFVDYGNVEDLKATEMRKNVYMGYIPIQCQKYALKGVTPISENGKWPVSVLDVVHSTIVEKQCRIVVLSRGTEDELPMISLTTPSNTDLADHLVKLHYAVYTTPEGEGRRLLSEASQCDVASDDGSVIIECTKEIVETHEEDRSTDRIEEIEKNDVQSICDVKIEEEEEVNKEDEGSTTEDELKVEDKPQLWSDLIMAESPTQDEDQKPLTYQAFDLQDYNEILIEVTAILSPTEIVIQLADCEENAVHNKEFQMITEIMQDEAPLQPLINVPYVGQPCCSCYSEDSQWYRAAVLVVEPSQVKVQYVDYGNVEYIPVNKVHQLKSEWMKVPVQGFQCSLWQVAVPEMFDPTELLTKLTECLFQPPLRAKIKQRDPVLSVTIVSPSSNIPVYQRLLDEGLFLKQKK